MGFLQVHYIINPFKKNPGADQTFCFSLGLSFKAKNVLGLNKFFLLTHPLEGIGGRWAIKRIKETDLN